MNGHGSLNRIFRVVWNATLGVWQVASELTRSKGKTKSMRMGPRGLARLTAGSILVLCHAGALAELPTGGHITAGSGNIGAAVDGKMVIHQSSDKMAINWDGFSLGATNSVQYIQPSADAIALNRVLGGDPSIIRGTISANGRVILLNPNGILFGPTSKIEVASLLASTLNMSNEDFMAGNFRLEGDSNNAVVNQGSILAKDGGFVALVAAKIENVGDIKVRGGEVLMGSGRKVRLDLGGPIKIEVDEAVVDGYIHNGGLIKAEGGTVIMTAKTAGELASLAINNEGIIEATSLARGDGGTIRLMADGATVTNSGTLNASSADGKGGHIEVTGGRVGILDGSVIDASGATGGGSVLLGGDYQGKNAAVNNAKLTFVDQGATVRANATREGDGGKVIVWADDRTSFNGSIEAKGGAEGGNGGFVEVSGKNLLNFQGTVDTSAAKGRNGTLLLDPTNLTIGNVDSSSWITQQSNAFGDFTTNTNPDPAHDFSFLRVDVLLAALANNDITVQSACDAANCVGNITVIDAITWNSGKALTLDATGGITLNADITSTGAAGKRGGDFNAIAGNGNIQVNANITTAGGTTTGAGLRGGNVNLTTAAGSVTLANGVTINTGGSDAAVGSNANGGNAGSITLGSTTGVALNNAKLLAAGGEGAGTGTTGAGGRISMSSTTGAISQSYGSEIAGKELVLRSTTGSVNLSSSDNAVESVAAQSDSGSITFNNRDDTGLTVKTIDGVTGVSTGESGSVQLSARNLQVNADVRTEDGSISLNGDQGGQSGDFSGVVVNGTNVTTQNGSIYIDGRGGDAEAGGQAGVRLLNGAKVAAGGYGDVIVNAAGGSGEGGANHGLVIEGNGTVDSGMIAAADGAIIINAEGGTAGDNNHAVVFRDKGQIGTSTGDHWVDITTTVGAGESSVAFASDADGGFIGTGNRDLTLTGDELSVGHDVPTNDLSADPAQIAVRSTGSLLVQSAGTSFTDEFKLSTFADGFNFNADGNGISDVSSLNIGKSGNTSGITIDQELDMAGKSVTLRGGDVALDEGISAQNLTVSASGDISQSQENGSFTLDSANLTSAGDITLNGTSNAVGTLTASAAGTLAFDNGGNALNLSGNLAGETIVLNAGSISQSFGTLTADALKVTATNGSVLLGSSNNIGTLAAQVDNGDFTIGNAGTTDALTIGTVDGLSGVTASGNVTFNPLYDLEIADDITAGGNVAVYSANRDIDLGTETTNRLSLTDAEMDHINASSLTLTTYNGAVHNSAEVLAGGVSDISITAGKGILNSGSGKLGFSHTDAGTLSLNSTGTEANTGIGTGAASLVTVGASNLVLSSQKDLKVDARSRAGSAVSGSANLDKLHMTLRTAGQNFSYGVLSSGATLNLTGNGVAPGWFEPVPKGTYNLSLSNTDALDFKFDGDAAINVNSASNIGAADFNLKTNYGIRVMSALSGTTGAITLQAGGSTGNYVGVSVENGITTQSGSIAIDGKGGTGRNSGDTNRYQSNQYGVNIVGGVTVAATNGGSISITGTGGSSSSEGANHDGVVVSGTLSGANGSSIAVNGTGGSGGLGTTSDGVVFAGSGNIANSGGSVKLTGKSGSGYSPRAIVQEGTGIIIAAGLEVNSTQSGRAVLTNDNNVGTLAGEVRTGFDFDNGGHNLIIGTVNERDGISGTSSGEVGLYDITNLTVNESIVMQSGDLQIAADTISIAEGKAIGDDSTGSGRSVDIDLRGRANKGQSSSRVVSIGAEDAAKLSITNEFLEQVYARDLTLNSSSTIDVMADTNFAHVGSELTLNGGTITNTADHYLTLSETGNNGTIELNGGNIGSDAHAILVRGADKVDVSSSGMFNIAAYTDDTNATDLIKLSALSINSTAGGANNTYSVDSDGLTYTANGDGSSYSVSAVADADPVSFSFRGNAAITVDADTDTKGGSFNVESTNGAVTVADGVAVTAGNASFTSTGNITLAGSASVDTTGQASFISSGSNSSFTTGTGNINAGNRIEIKTDSVALGGGLLTVSPGGTSEIVINPVSSSRAIQLGGTDTGSLSLSAAELDSMSADKLVIGRNNINSQISSSITMVGAVDLSDNFSTLSLNSYNSGGVSQNSGATVTVDNLEVSLHSGNITLEQNNAIGSFSASTDGTVKLTNVGNLNLKGASSSGKEIKVTTSGNLVADNGSIYGTIVNSTANGTGVNANAGSITLEATNGTLTVLGGISANGYSYSSNTAQDGGTITLRGQNVEIGQVSINSTGSYNSTTDSTGGKAGALVVDATAVGGTVTLDGTTINVQGGGAGGTNGVQGLGYNLSFSDAVVLGALSGDTFSPKTVQISTGGGSVNFNNTVNGGADGGHNLTINSSRRTGTTTAYGNVTFGQNVGADHEIGNLNVYSVQDVTLKDVNALGISVSNTGGTTKLEGDLSTSGVVGINLNSNSLNVSAGVGYTTTGGGDIKLATKGSLMLADTTAFHSSGNIDLTAESGITISGTSLTTEGSGIIFRSATTLASNLTIDTTNGGVAADGGNVEFHSTLDSNGSAGTLTIAAGTEGNVVFTGAVGNASQLGAVTIDSANNVTTSNTFKAASFTQTDGTGTTTFGGATTLGGDFSFTGNALTVNNALNANKVTVGNAGQFTTGAAGDITATNGFTQNGAGSSTLAGDINTTGTDITFATPVTLAGTLTLSTGATGGGDVSFADTLDSAYGSDMNTATITTGDGNIVFDGAVGATNAVGNLVLNSNADVILPTSLTARSLITNAGGNTVLQDGSVITTVSGQNYGDAVKLDGDATLASTGYGAINFSGTVSGPHSLAVNTDGTTTFGGAVGGGVGQALSELSVQGAANINGGSVTTTGDQTYGGNVLLGADTIMASTDGGDVTFNGTVNSSGSRSLEVNTTGTTAFNGAVGNSSPLSSITVANQDGTLEINGGLIRTAGNQQYNSGNIILGGDTTLQSTGAGSITLDGDVDAAVCTVASLNVLTQGATVFGGAIGTYRPLWSVTTDGAASVPGNTVNFENGTVVTLGDQTYGELAVLGTNTTLTSLGQGTVSFNGPVRAKDDGVQSLAINTAGDIVFNDKVGDNGQRLASLDTSMSKDGSVLLNGGDINTTGAQIYGGSAVLGTNTTLTSDSGGNVRFNGTVDGNHELTVNTAGATIFNGAIGGTSALASVTTDEDGTVQINGGKVNTTGSQTYGDDVKLGANTTLTSTLGGDVHFGGKVDGARSLAVNTAGTTVFDDTVGGTTALTSLTTDGDGDVVINAGSIKTSGSQHYGDAVTLGADTTLTSTQNGDVQFDGTVDGVHKLAVNTGGKTAFNGAVGGTDALTSLSTDNGGSVAINGGIVKTTGGQNYGDAVTLGTDTTLTSTNDGEVRFRGTVNGAHSLAVETGGATVFDGAVGGTTALTSLTTDGPGSTSLNGGVVRTTGDQNYGDAVKLGAHTTLASLGGGDVHFNDTLDGGYNLAVNTSGETLFDGAVGGTTALAGLTTDGPGSTIIGGGTVRTTGDQNYGDAVTLAADTTIDSTQGGVNFARTVDGAHQLTVNTARNTTFGGVVGGTTELTGLKTGGAGNVAINGGGVHTTGDQRYDNAVTLGANTVLTSSDEGDVTFGKTLDGAHSLNVESAGTTTFGGAVGGKTALASITTDDSGNAVINGGLVRISGAQTFNDGVMLGADTTFTGGGPITFGDTLDGPWKVVVNTSGLTTFGGAVGSKSPISSLTTDSRGQVQIDGPSITSSGTLRFNDRVTVTGPTTVNAGKDALFYGDAIGKELLTVTAPGLIQFGYPAEIENIKNYLPTLLAAGKQANANAPAFNTNGAGRDASRQTPTIGNLEIVDIAADAGSSDTGNMQSENVNESAIDQTVQRIASSDDAGSKTYIVTVQGGVRSMGEQMEENK